jgi:hypothetical protein
MENKVNAWEILEGKPKANRLLGRPRYRWEDIKNLPLKGCVLDLSGSGYGPAVGSCEHDNEHSDSIKRWEFLSYLSSC